LEKNSRQIKSTRKYIVILNGGWRDKKINYVEEKEYKDRGRINSKT
jgi:hypothetical protein